MNRSRRPHQTRGLQTPPRTPPPNPWGQTVPARTSAPVPGTAHLRRLLRAVADTPLILWHYATHPRRIGAVAPSSRFLAQAMARWVPIPPGGYVLELGAGTGAVTECLLLRGVPPEQLVAVETMPRMVEVLRKRFPGIHILQGDARQLTDLLRQHLGANVPVSAVVSSLPLRAFSPKDQQQVVRQIQQLLPPGRRWIQFRYRLRHEPSLHWPGFRVRQTIVVWWNIPPARVVLYERTTEPNPTPDPPFQPPHHHTPD